MPPVYLNHLLIFLDAETYRSIGASGFLNGHFACSEERTTHDQATDMSWTGRYYYGRETYFEFMDPGRTSWAPRDAIAFGIEREGGSEDLAGRLERALKRDITRFKRKRRYRDQDIPWFWTVDIPRKEDARLISWVMEYDPWFLDRWAPDLPPGMPRAGTDRIARSGFLTRYRSAIGDDLPGRLFRDITSVTVTLPPEEADLLEAELEVYGYVSTELAVSEDSRRGNADPGEDGEVGVEPTASLEQKKYHGPDIEIVVERINPYDVGAKSGHVGAVAGIGGITEFSMETQPVSVTTTHIFSPECRLIVEKSGTATWSFGHNHK